MLSHFAVKPRLPSVLKPQHFVHSIQPNAILRSHLCVGWNWQTSADLLQSLGGNIDTSDIKVRQARRSSRSFIFRQWVASRECCSWRLSLVLRIWKKSREKREILAYRYSERERLRRVSKCWSCGGTREITVNKSYISSLFFTLCPFYRPTTFSLSYVANLIVINLFIFFVSFVSFVSKVIVKNGSMVD